MPTEGLVVDLMDHAHAAFGDLSFEDVARMRWTAGLQLFDELLPGGVLGTLAGGMDSVFSVGGGGTLYWGLIRTGIRRIWIVDHVFCPPNS